MLDNRSGIQGVEEGITPLTITPSDTLRKFVFSVPTTLCSIGIEIWPPEKELLTRDLAKVPLNSKLLPGHLGFLVSKGQQAEKGLSILAKSSFLIIIVR